MEKQHMREYLILGIVAILLVFSKSAPAQPSGSIERPNDWHWGLIAGYMSGDTILKTKDINEETITAKADSGTVLGVRYGMDREFLGLEASLKGVFSDLEIQADSAAIAPSGGDADLYLATVDLLWYPTGNDLDQGRFRPFLALSPGVGFFDSDFDEVDGEWVYDIAAGAGFKLFTGDEGNPIIRLDWRWHVMKDFDKNFEWIYRQELTLGVGFRF
jgi:hypothetical protein